MNFEIKEIRHDEVYNKISVSVECEDGHKERFVYSLNDGWGDEVDGEPKFLYHIRDCIKKREKVKEKTIDIDKIKNLKGKVSSTEKKEVVEDADLLNL